MLLLSILTLLTVPGCEQRFSDDNLKVVNREVEQSEEQIRKGVKDSGVSPKEVESILGLPKRIETHKLPLETQKKEVELVQYFYEQDGETFELHFFDGKLISKVKTFQERAQDKKMGEKLDRSPEEAAAAKADQAEKAKEKAADGADQPPGAQPDSSRPKMKLNEVPNP